MTPDKVRMVHVLARARKGLTEDEYRLRLKAVNVDSCKQLDREAFRTLVDGLNRLPDAPAWSAKRSA